MVATAALAVGPLTLVADASGALVDADERILLVADLHLEKGSAYAARGVLLPPYDSRATLALLADAVRRWQPRLVVALGDTLHDRGAGGRIAAEELATLAGLQAGRPRPGPGPRDGRHGRGRTRARRRDAAARTPGR
jgi:metallophosphoesterase superfamily enzyme